MKEAVLNTQAIPHEEKTSGDVWADLEDRLKRHDWYYAYSDDHRVWMAGEAARRALESSYKAAKDVDFSRARGIFMKYAPPGCLVPA